ncbi:hypothetical protein HR45_02870 [Shewanella mangrovi]|uniref:Uncharacterized protein n=1 Tax=Shewanella mangrovi TaxID=1515746 RepID=A0A094K195_9GAMM|nr:hypothetical protein [Shewanella mangrovi]KFZ38406.1 hypothetical protein HR45_02870 [Shewanella mangrovi]
MNASSVNLFNVEGRYRALKKLHASLTDEERRFVRTQQLDAGHSAAYWQKFFQRLIQLDVLGSELRRFYRKQRTWLIVLNILGVFFLAGLGYTSLMLLLFVALLYSWIRLKYCRLMDVDNSVRTGLVKLFQVLALETRFIKLKLDLRPTTARQVSRRRQPDSRTTLEFFDIPLLQLRAQFKDGNQVSMRIDDVLCKRTCKKISRSGRRKTKIKYKGRRNIRVSLNLNDARYIKRNGKLAADSKCVTQHGQQKIVTQFKLKYDGETKYVDAENLLKTVAKAYQQTKVKTFGAAA